MTRPLRTLEKSAVGNKFRILKLGSGPAREIREGLESSGLPLDEVEFTYVDIDGSAIAYAKSLLGDEIASRVSLHHGNALRYNPRASFDFIRSAGLFDYLENDDPPFFFGRYGGIWLQAEN